MRGRTNIYKITMDTAENPHAEYLKGAFYWHIDGTMWNVPTFAAVLSARRLAPSGGQPSTAITYAAYDDLPDSEKREYEKLKVVAFVRSRATLCKPGAELCATSGVAEERHQDRCRWSGSTATAGKSLILGCTAAYVVGMSPEQSAALLCRLRDLRDSTAVRSTGMNGNSATW